MIKPEAILSVAQMRRADELTIAAGISGFSLLSNAGKAVFEAAVTELETGDRVLVTCGTGNNGGDGLVAASLLHIAGFKVTVVLCGLQSSVTGDARLALDCWLNTHEQPVQASEHINLLDYTLVIDAMLGTGLDRPVSGALALWIEQINQSGLPIISVDIPSGINGDTGAICGTAISANKTVTFFRKKPGHLLYPGCAHCGKTSIAQIGIDESALTGTQLLLSENLPVAWQGLLPTPDWSSHKYTRGHCIVACGTQTNTGAARLAARAALRAGAGLVTLACPQPSIAVVAASLAAEMLVAIDKVAEWVQLLGDKRISSVVIGPALGVTENTRLMVKAALEKAPAVVLDADALSSFVGHQDVLFHDIAQSNAQVVLTPHHGEFSRLFSSLQARDPDLALPKTELALAAAAHCGAVVVFKGPDTVIASPTGECRINANAPPWLATAGSGDVLAGTIGGLMAQGVSAFDAAGAGCWIHAEAAKRFGPGLIASDLESQYPAVLARLLDPASYAG